MTTQGHHEATRPYQLGIDVGSTTVKAVVLHPWEPSSPTSNVPCPAPAFTRPSPAPAA